MKLIAVTFVIVFLFSCKQGIKESTTTKVHHSLSTDTTFLFPDEYRKKNFRDDEFENNSRWLNVYNENKLFNNKGFKKYIRLAYGRAFDNPIIVIIEQDKITIKESDISKTNNDSHFDSTLLTIEERKWLQSYYHFKWLNSKHKEDSAIVINQILSTYPDITDSYKKLYLINTKGKVYEQDSTVYTEKKKILIKSIADDLFKKLDSLNFWDIRPNVFYESVMDGSGFFLEAKNGSKYNVVDCSNCEVKNLIELRNELLKLTNLKKDEIY